MAETIPTMKGAATPVSTRQEEAVYYHPTLTSQARPTLLFYLSLVTSRLLSIYLACSASSFGLLSIICRPAGLLGYCVFSLLADHINWWLLKSFTEKCRCEKS